MSPRSQMRRIYGKPFALATLTGFGLILALIADGTWDVASWIALGAPLMTVVWLVLRPVRTR